MGLTMNRERTWLAAPRDYIEHGTPVFVAAPTDGAEFKYPSSWQSARPDMQNLDSWQPGWAACAVTGVVFDVIDVDPRHGGDESLAGIREAGLLPPVYGEVGTPSGGQHLYVAKSGLRKCTPAPGIDLQAGDAIGKGRGFVFITPTIRTSKVDGRRKVYQLITPIDWDGLREAARHEPWLDFVRRSRRPEPATKADPVAWMSLSGIGLEDVTAEDIKRTDASRKAYYAAGVRGIIQDILDANPGERNTTLNKCATKLGSLAAGLGFAWEPMAVELARAAISKGLSKAEVVRTLQSGIKAGLQNPRSV